jgi:hypothetical protein
LVEALRRKSDGNVSFSRCRYVFSFSNLLNPSSRKIAPRLTQPRTEMRISKLLGEVKNDQRVRLKNSPATALVSSSSHIPAVRSPVAGNSYVIPFLLFWFTSANTLSEHIIQCSVYIVDTV